MVLFCSENTTNIIFKNCLEISFNVEAEFQYQNDNISRDAEFCTETFPVTILDYDATRWTQFFFIAYNSISCWSRLTRLSSSLGTDTSPNPTISDSRFERYCASGK